MVQEKDGGMMGMQLDPTSEMGDLVTEIRSKSAYIYGNGLLYAEDGVVEFDLRDISKLRAALDQIEQYIINR